MSDDSFYFVYLRGVGGKAWPQKWYGDQTKGTGEFKHGAVGAGDLLQFVKLSAEEAEMTIPDLEKKYPYTDQPMAVSVDY